MAEHSAVNRRVVGSSPTWGAIRKTAETTKSFSGFFICPKGLSFSECFYLPSLAGFKPAVRQLTSQSECFSEETASVSCDCLPLQDISKIFAP